MSEAATKNTCNNSRNSDAGPPQMCFNLPSRKDVITASKQPDLPIDVLLVTVRDCEFLACYREIKDPVRYCYKDLGYVYFNDVFQSQQENVKVALVHCTEGAVGPNSSLIAIMNAARILRPKAVISVGACSSLNPDKTKLGDVVVSAKLSTYASKVVTSDQDQSAGMRSYVSKLFLKLIPNCADGWQAPLMNPKDFEIKVHCDGEFLSGPEKIKAEKRRKELADLYPLAAAVEMEGEGVFTAAFETQLEWLIVKGIADYADGEQRNADNWKAFASALAASLVSHILNDPVVFLDWPHFPVDAQSKRNKKRKLRAHHSATAAVVGTMKRLKEVPSVPVDVMSPMANMSNLTAVNYADNNGKECQLAENKERNLLHSAAEGGDVSVIETMLSLGFDVNSKDSFGTTPLMLAAAKGNREAVNALISKGANPSLTNNKGRNLLHAAVEGGDVSIVEMFLPNIPIDSSDNNGVTSLMIAACDNNLEIIEFLLSKSADPFLKTNKGKNVLFISAQYGHIDVIAQMCPRFFHIDSQDDTGCTPLMCSAAYAKLQAINYLLENGADPLLTAKNGWSLLHYASQGGNTTIIESILSCGLEVDIKDTIKGLTPLMVSVVQNNQEAIKYLLEKGADPSLELSSLQFNSLQIAVTYSESSDVSRIIAVLSSGHSINMQNSLGQTALMVAAFYKKPEVVDFLLHEGADPFLIDTFGRSVLHHASEGGHVTIIDKFLSRGLDLESKDIDGNTPLMMAASSGNAEAVQFLLQQQRSSISSV